MNRGFLFRSALCALAAAVLTACAASAAPGRTETDLSGKGWRMFLDKSASWQNDTIFMPPVDMTKVPVNPPVCGWDSLATAGEKVEVPGTVEEYHWADMGDYRGVSWWCTTFKANPSMKGKRFVLKFDSVVLRAEVFVNHKLMGYDVIGNVPFDVDITNAVRFDAPNAVDIRITDPGGNFSWSNNDFYMWGKNMVPANHGFGGITGKVVLRITDAVSIDDLYMQNKQSVTDVEAFVTLANTSGKAQAGQLSLTIADWKSPKKVVWEKTIPATVPPSGITVSIPANVPNAKPWNIHQPNLYVAKATFTATSGAISDTDTQRFGFRWLSIKKVDGDEMFFMNDRRIFILDPMNRGFWPKNGIFPTPAMLKKGIDMLQTMGFTMCLMNQAIGRPEMMAACDEAGLVSYEELGGYRCSDKPDAGAMAWRTEKARRMAIRDRSSASLIIYVMKCETSTPPSDDDRANMKMIHTLDPARLITYNSDCDPKKRSIVNAAPDPFKLHMRPGETEFREYGWWNQHHWVPFQGYLDQYWKNPNFYLRKTLIETNTDSLPQLGKDEIVYLGEEGSFGSQVRLQKIKEELDKEGAKGWREQEYLDCYASYKDFLDRSGYKKYFPSVDKFTMALGVNSLYYEGRLVESCRSGNIFDGINIHCWDDGGSTPSIGDLYRNPVADPAIFSHYTQPLYVAVKIRTKVHQVGDDAIADFLIVNELDLKGPHTLEAKLYGPDKSVVFSKTFDVNIIGGVQFGQLLVEGVKLPALTKPGYYTLKARILNGKSVKADGFDDIYVADYMKGPGLKGTWAVIDTSGVINTFLTKVRGVALPAFDSATKSPYDNIVVNQTVSADVMARILDMVGNGSTAIVFAGADAWVKSMPKGAVTVLGNSQRGGRYFVGGGRFMEGLPKTMAMNWEYQEFYHSRGGSSLFIDPKGTELIVGDSGTQASSKNVTAAVTRIPVGKGSIILSTLDFTGKLPMTIPEAAVPKKLFMNLLEIGQRNVK
jgi:beta-galactosidase